MASSRYLPPEQVLVGLNLSIKDFELLNVLGDGSLSTVIHARLKQTGEDSALKVMDKIYLSRHKKVDDAIRERNIMDRLQGGFTGRLKFTFQDDDKIYLGMELFLNGDLYSQMEKRHPMPLADVRFYAAEIVLILEHLRKNHVLSRDIKPENLLLTETGHLVLIDFGCAKILTEAEEHPARDEAGSHMKDGESMRVGSFKGTADYMAPEVLSGAECTYSIDLWSLGCVIYQMFVNKPPFRYWLAAFKYFLHR